MPAWQQPSQQSYQPGGISVETLNRDISNLIEVSKADFSVTPWDTAIQGRLKALLDLQTVLRTQQIPQEQLALIQVQVNQMSQASHASRPNVPQAAPVTASVPTPIATPVIPVSTSLQANTISSLLGSGALAALLARQSATPQSAQAVPVPLRSPQPNLAIPHQQAVATPTPVPAPTPDALALLQRLRASGIIGGGGTPITKSPALPSTQPSILPPGFPNIPPPVAPNGARPILGEIPNDVVLKPASLKM